MPRGRPPKPGTAEEKAAARRERVRLNVKALRERRKQSSENENPAASGSTSNTIQSDARGDAEIGQEGWNGESQRHVRSSSVDEEFLRFNVDGSRIQTILSTRSKLIYQLSTASQYRLALLSAFRGHLLPDSVHLPNLKFEQDMTSKASANFIWTPCAFWVTNAFDIASKTPDPSLNSILMALGVGIEGQQRTDESMRATAAQLYRNGLRGIFYNLEQVMKNPKSYAGGDNTTLYLTCHAAAIYELMVNPSLEATLRHLKGIAQLMSYLESESGLLTWSIPTLLLQDYRMLEITIALRFRYEPVLSPKKGFARLPSSNIISNPNSKAGPLTSSSSTMMSAITDAGDDICSVLVQIDRLKSLAVAENIRPQLQKLLCTLATILEDFGTWMEQLKTRYGPVPFSRSTNFKNLDDTGSLFSFEVGSAWMYSFLIKAYGLETMIEVHTLLRNNQQLHSGNNSLRTEQIIASSVPDVLDFKSHYAPSEISTWHTTSVQQLRAELRTVSIQLTHSVFYFFQTDKGVIGQALSIFPLDTADVMLRQELNRLQEDIGQVNILDSLQLNSSHWLSDAMEEVIASLDMCHEMQLRAKQYGLPTVYPS